MKEQVNQGGRPKIGPRIHAHLTEEQVSLIDARVGKRKRAEYIRVAVQMRLEKDMAG